MHFRPVEAGTGSRMGCVTRNGCGSAASFHLFAPADLPLLGISGRQICQQGIARLDRILRVGGLSGRCSPVAVCRQFENQMYTTPVFSRVHALGYLSIMSEMRGVDTVKVKEVMKSPVITVNADDTLADVSRKFHEERISGAPVVDADGKLVGIVSEGDLIKRSQELQVNVSYDIFGWVSPHTSIAEMASFTQGLCSVADTKVSEVMTRKVITVSLDDLLERAASIMTRRNINRVPVMDGSELVGILSRADLVRAMVHLNELGDRE